MAFGGVELHPETGVWPEESEPTVSVVIPAKNEADNLPRVLAELPRDIYEVILVDGYSSDDTVQVAQRLRPDIITIGQTRKGKGNALACGFAVASGEFIVMLDADGSANPSEIRRFVDALSTAPTLPRAPDSSKEVGAATSAGCEGSETTG